MSCYNPKAFYTVFNNLKQYNKIIMEISVLSDDIHIIKSIMNSKENEPRTTLIREFKIQRLLNNTAYKYIMIGCYHDNGSSQPIKTDFKVIEHTKKCLATLDHKVELLDYLIVSNDTAGETFSFYEHNLL